MQAFADSRAKGASLLVSQAASFAKAMVQVYTAAAQHGGSGDSSGVLGRCCSLTPRNLTADRKSVV